MATVALLILTVGHTAPATLMPARLVAGQEASPAAKAPDISVFEVVGRAQAAIQAVRTYRVEQYTIEDGNRTLDRVGQVDIEAGERWETPDGYISYWVDSVSYIKGPAGGWVSTENPPRAFDEFLRVFLRLPGTEWTLVGLEVVDGRPAYGIRRTYVYEIPREETIWIDASTFLPIKDVVRSDASSALLVMERVYSGFGDLVDVKVPADALEPAPAPTPEPTPPPVEPQSFDPHALLTHLWLSGFPGSDLPAGFASAELGRLDAGALDQFADIGISGALGAVEASIPSGSSSQNQIVYFVYPSAEAAEAAFEAAESALPRRGFAVTGSCVVGTLFTGTTRGYAAAFCLAPVGNVVVLGQSVLSEELLSQAGVNAMDLAGAGVAHLRRLLESNPPPTVPSLPAAPPATIVEIHGRGGWQDSGLQVRRGDTVLVRYLSGTWSTLSDEDNARLTAAGHVASGPDPSGGVIPFPYGALIARVGEGQPVGVGAELTFQAEEDGTLEFRMNDRDTSDNSGGIRVAVVVSAAHAPSPDSG